MQPSVPPDVRARVMPAVIDELARWGVERFSVEAMAERHQLDAATVYRYWGDRQRLIVDAAIADVETQTARADTGSLRGDLTALARALTERLNTDVGRTMVRAVAMDRPGHHDEETRKMFWAARFQGVRAVVDRARQRGELREDVNTLAAVLMVLAPLNIRALYSDEPIDEKYCAAVADMAWHALARK
ncbi:TetR family transcriptional regulator [Mycobacterium alsense]|uniref:TetR family transcriptional regulator n=1 Tax=Mycobacterium alsense TaxID=324058 RepID=A0AA41XTK7_9MYCO|nr:TetR-like C-terminal domain-containing protein [Mycobacterium alsense]MCV7381017.1 TetR/AcrR family transcriptional regulator C-terminal ligand-binding domain-containing protein [Mycobacterium alsense]OQZ91416.1 TetR family transcriptional regulator [Mycobacterium alsense]